MQFLFIAIEQHNFFACNCFSYSYFAINLIGIKCMHRLTNRMQNIIGCINHIVFGLDINGTQTVLQPLRRRCNFHPLYFNSIISFAQCSIRNFNRQFFSRIFYLRDILLRDRQSQKPRQIAGNSQMRRCISAVRS